MTALVDYMRELESDVGSVMVKKLPASFDKGLTAADVFYATITALLKVILLSCIRVLVPLKKQGRIDALKEFSEVERLFNITLSTIEKELLGDVDTHHSEQPDA